MFISCKYNHRVVQLIFLALNVNRCLARLDYCHSKGLILTMGTLLYGWFFQADICS